MKKDTDLKLIDYDDFDDLYLSDEELAHYGMPKRSGRYPWGSGENPFQRTGTQLSRVEQMKKDGMSETQIAKALGISTTQLRTYNSLEKDARRKELVATVKGLKEKGMNNVEIAKKLDLKGESTVRSLLNSDSESRMNIAQTTAIDLKSIVDSKEIIDIGVGTWRELGISKEKMDQAIEILKLDGYNVYVGRVPQATNPGQHTTVKVLTKPGIEHKDMYNYGDIQSIRDYRSPDGASITKDDKGNPVSFIYPSSLDSKRVHVRYREDGGHTKDGVIELRRGVEDISLGNSNYAQVRILVDDTHYLKGMAVYSDNMPPGVDVIFNTNKSNVISKKEAMKKITDDPDNPFGSLIKETGGQSFYEGPDGKPTLRVINKTNEEGDWGNWSNTVSSQFLSKQPMKLIKRQLNISMDDKQAEFDEIMTLTNPAVKRKLLETFANDADSASVHLKAAALPGQHYKVILPINSLKDNEVYAPHLRDGTEVALVRYPHAGTFEIPKLIVNNHNKEGRDILTPSPTDAIGINSKVAERLSGADFDGDTVMVIPITDRTNITSTRALKQLEGFDPGLNYGPDAPPKVVNGIEVYTRGGIPYKTMNENSIQLEMGKISNLITDMTLKGAPQDEVAKAVKHSMVVIDAYKHNLDYKQSYIDNDIKRLSTRYQQHYDDVSGKIKGGASTLISKASSEIDVSERRDGAITSRSTGERVEIIDPKKRLYYEPSTGKTLTQRDVKTLYIDPKTGEKLYSETGREFKRVVYKGENGKTRRVSIIEKDGKNMYKDEYGNLKEVTNEEITVTEAKSKSTRMDEVKDASQLSSGLPQEEAYVVYANKMKSLANQARKELIVVKNIPYSSSANKAYRDEVDSLLYKLNQSLLNAPKERQAQTIAASIIKAKKAEDPKMPSDREKKLRQQEISKARALVGAKRTSIDITDREWEAIQAGALSDYRVRLIINNADLAKVRQLAMPRDVPTLTAAKIRRMKSLAASGYTLNEIASALGVSPSTVSTQLKGDE